LTGKRSVVRLSGPPWFRALENLQRDTGVVDVRAISPMLKATFVQDSRTIWARAATIVRKRRVSRSRRSRPATPLTFEDVAELGH